MVHQTRSYNKYDFCELNLRYDDEYEVLHKISSERVLCFIRMKDIGMEEQYVRTCSTRPRTLHGWLCLPCGIAGDKASYLLLFDHYE